MKHHMDIDRTKPARARRRVEFQQLKNLPYRKKEQEGRYVWLRIQIEIDRNFAEKEAHGTKDCR